MATKRNTGPETFEQTKGTVLRLVPRRVSRDAVMAAQQLLQDVVEGKVAGYAIVMMHSATEYSVDIAGDCHEFPTLTRGMIGELWDELGRRST